MPRHVAVIMEGNMRDLTKLLSGMAQKFPLRYLTRMAMQTLILCILRLHSSNFAETSRRLSPSKALRFALEIARGMNYLHECKPEPIIHGDLKPKCQEHLARFWRAAEGQGVSLYSMLFSTPSMEAYHNADCRDAHQSFEILLCVTDKCSTKAKALKEKGLEWKVGFFPAKDSNAVAGKGEDDEISGEGKVEKEMGDESENRVI
ncbi:integrin-linked protein kinase family [Striga asiatica]|uniref:Integrin-linked protein kinase family n=1 Tax=Striga asiatica TaxID=4170 RepID=A0A5A7PRM3_STRAF|nr:integrin-linked protein kinase family [Striga asiatica]